MLKIRLTRNKWDGMIAEPIFIQNSILVNGKDPFLFNLGLQIDWIDIFIMHDIIIDYLGQSNWVIQP